MSEQKPNASRLQLGFQVLYQRFMHGSRWALLLVIGIIPVRADPLPPNLPTTMPGAPLARVGLAQSQILIAEGPDTSEPIIRVTLPVQVSRGFIVLTENGASKDPSNWSDVLFFHLITVSDKLTGEVVLISDGLREGSITDADLAAAGLTIAGIQSTIALQSGPNPDGITPCTDPTTSCDDFFFRPEQAIDGGFGIIYTAGNSTLPPGEPGTVTFLSYKVISDVPEPATLILLGLGLAGLVLRKRTRA